MYVKKTQCILVILCYLEHVVRWNSVELFFGTEGLKAEIKRLRWLIIPYGPMMTAQNKFGGGGWMNYRDQLVNDLSFCKGSWLLGFTLLMLSETRVWEVQAMKTSIPSLKQMDGRNTIVSFGGKWPIFRTFAASFGGVHVYESTEWRPWKKYSSQSYHSVIYFILVGLPLANWGYLLRVLTRLLSMNFLSLTMYA